MLRIISKTSLLIAFLCGFISSFIVANHRILEAPRTVQEIVKLQREPDTAITQLQLKNGFVIFNKEVQIPVSGIYQFSTPQTLVNALQVVNLLLVTGGICALVDGVLECEYSSTSSVINPLILKSHGIKIYQCPDPEELNNQVVDVQKSAMIHVKAEPQCDGSFSFPCHFYQVSMYVNRSDIVKDAAHPGYINLKNSFESAGVDIDSTSKNRVPLRYKVLKENIFMHQVTGKFGDKIMLSTSVNNNLVMQNGQMVINPEETLINSSDSAQKANIQPCRMMNVDINKNEVMCCYGGPCETTGLKVIGKLPTAIEKCKIYGLGMNGRRIKEVIDTNKYLSFDFYQYAKSITMPDGTEKSIPAEHKSPVIIVCED